MRGASTRYRNVKGGLRERFPESERSEIEVGLDEDDLAGDPDEVTVARVLAGRIATELPPEHP